MVGEGIDTEGIGKGSCKLSLELAMAAAAAPALQQEGRCLFCLSEQFNDEYGSQPTRWVNHSCSNCLGPLVASVDLVEQDEWETLFHAACFEEMGRDFKISNAAKSVKLRGFPPPG
eukprot:jgi/Tetstr1/440672/TSEL_028981.t1